jgi:predicted secreted protein
VAKIAGRNAAIYVSTTTSAAASPLTNQNSWSMSFEVEKIDVTSFGNTTKEYVAGIADASGEFSGFYDDASNQTLTAALDGLSRKLYLYPNSNTATQYFFGTIFPDMSINADVDGAVEVSASWSAASPIAKVG